MEGTEEEKGISKNRGAIAKPNSEKRKKRRVRKRRASLEEEDEEGPDLSWKDAGRIFPKRSSSVGPEHQVTTIPSAGTVTIGDSER